MQNDLLSVAQHLLLGLANHGIYGVSKTDKAVNSVTLYYSRSKETDQKVSELIGAVLKGNCSVIVIDKRNISELE